MTRATKSDQRARADVDTIINLVSASGSKSRKAIARMRSSKAAPRPAKARPDPVFAAIKAHKAAVAATENASHKLTVLEERIKQSEKHLPTCALRASQKWPVLWIGSAYRIENAGQAKAHIQRYLMGDMASRVGPKTLAKIKSLQDFAIAELMAELDKVSGAHARQRNKSGLTDLSAAKWESVRAEDKAFISLRATMATTPGGIAALIEYATRLADTDMFAGASVALLDTIAASVKRLARQ